MWIRAGQHATVMQNVKDVGFLARISTTSPEHIAHSAVKAMFARKPVVVPLFVTKLYVGLVRLMPRSIMTRMIGNKFRRSKVRLYKTPQQQNEQEVEAVSH